MPDFSDNSGVLFEEYFIDDDGTIHVRASQDAQPALDWAAIQRNEVGYQSGLRPKAEIPWALALEWRKQGLDIFNPEHAALLEKKLKDIEYKKLLSTERAHLNIRVTGSR